MHVTHPLLIAVALLLALANGPAVAATTQEWISYRDAYRAMALFERYQKPKHLIQNHLQVIPRNQDASLAGLQLTLHGKSIQVNLPIDATGRTVFPVLKAAYDENAALFLNREPGAFTIRPQVSIIVQPDGKYDIVDLRTACEQALAWQRHLSATSSTRKCVGVRFDFDAAAGDPAGQLRTTATGELAGRSTKDAALGITPSPGVRTVTYRFTDTPVPSEVVTTEAPLMIAALIE